MAKQEEEKQMPGKVIMEYRIKCHERDCQTWPICVYGGNVEPVVVPEVWAEEGMGKKENTVTVTCMDYVLQIDDVEVG